MHVMARTLFVTVLVLMFTGIFPLPVAFDTSGYVVQAQTKVAKVEGFRSAKFGMGEQDIIRRVKKDFNISKKRVKRQVHPIEKTLSLEIEVKDLLKGSGRAKVFYIFGYRSKKLIQVNVLWGKPVGDNFKAETVVETANQLRNHFAQKNFPKEGLVVNQPLNKEGTAVLVFRGKDKKGRMALLILENPKVAGKKENAHISLKLSYIKNPDSQDVFKIKEEDF